MNSNSISAQDKLKLLGAIFSGEHKKCYEAEGLYNSLIEYYENELLPAIVTSDYAATSYFSKAMKVLLSKVELLLAWPELLGKTVIGVLYKDNFSGRRFIMQITNSMPLPQLECPILITPRAEKNSYRVKGKYTPMYELEENTLEELCQVSSDIPNLASYMDAIEIPCGKFKNTVLLVCSEAILHNNLVWNDLIQGFVSFSADKKLISKESTRPILILGTNNTKKKNNCTYCRNVSNAWETWLQKMDKPVWRNLYYEEFLALFLKIDANLASKKERLSPLISQYNEDSVLGIPVDEKICQKVVDWDRNASDKLEKIRKAYKEFLHRLSEINEKISAISGINHDTLHVNDDLLLEICLLSYKLEYYDDFSKYSNLLKERKYRNYFLIDFYRDNALELLTDSSILELKKAENTNVYVKRAKVRFAEKIGLQSEGHLALVLEYEQDVDDLDATENELLGDCYFVEAQKNMESEAKAKYLDEAKSYWENALLLGADDAGKKLYSNFGIQNREYLRYLALQGEKNALMSMSKDDKDGFYLKLRAARGELCALYELAETEFAKITSYAIEGSTYSPHNFLESQRLLILQTLISLLQTLISQWKINYVELIAMYKKLYENFDALQKEISRDKQTITREQIKEKEGFLHFMCFKLKEDQEGRYRERKFAIECFERAQTPIALYWLGRLELDDIKEENLQTNDKSHLETAKKYFSKALELQPNYSYAKSAMDDVDNLLQEWEQKFNKPPKPPTCPNYCCDDSFCVPDGTLITLATGTKVSIDQIKCEDKILAFNHFTGQIESTDVYAIIKHGNMQKTCRIVTLTFSDGTKTSLIKAHCYYDATLDQYVEISSENVSEFIKHVFLRVEKDGLTRVTLIAVCEEERQTKMYEIVTKNTLNFVSDGILSASMYLDKWLNMFDFIPQTYTYDRKLIEDGIANYGLAEPENYPVLAAEYFAVINGRFLNIAVALKKITLRDVCSLNYLANKYL